MTSVIIASNQWVNETPLLTDSLHSTACNCGMKNVGLCCNDGFLKFLIGTITLKILPKIVTKGLTSDDVSSLCDRSYAVMRAAFLDISGQSPQSNGPSNH